jgi:hypothetical protein
LLLLVGDEVYAVAMEVLEHDEVTTVLRYHAEPQESVQEPDDRKSGCGCCAVAKVPLKHTEQGTLCVALDQ